MSKPIDYKTLIAYQDGLLTPERMREVQYAIETDEFIRAQWEEIAIARAENPEADLEVLLGLESLAAKEKGQEQSTDTTSVQRSRNYGWLAAAATIAIALGVFWFVSNNDSSADSYAALRDASFTTVENVRGSEEAWQTDYNAGKWDNVIRALQNKPDKTLSEEFYLGVAYLKTGQPSKGIPHLELSLKSEFLSSDANFALAQCYYELKEKAKANACLKRTNHANKAQLQALVDKMK